MNRLENGSVTHPAQSPTLAKLALEFADAERLWLSLSPASQQWIARFDERLVDEQRLERAAMRFYAGVQREMGTPRDLAVLGQEIWKARTGFTKFRRRSTEPQLEAALRGELDARLDDAVIKSLVREMQVEILEVSERAEASILAIMFGTALGKQIDPTESVPGVRWTPQSLAHSDLREKLVLDVEKAVEATGTNYTTDVAAAIVDAADPASPVSIQSLVKTISTDVTNISRKKAFTLARTETARVYGQTAHESMVQNQIKKRRWLTAANSPVASKSPPDPICLENAAQGWIPLTQPFSSGDMYSPAHHNCRCDIAPNVDDWLPPIDAGGVGGFFF